MTSAILLALAALTAPSASPAPPEKIIAGWVRSTGQNKTRVNVWLNTEDVYHKGDQARVYFTSEEDAYVAIVRIDTDGRIRMLFPVDPWEDNWARHGKTFEVLGRDQDEAFRVYDYPGLGYVFAIASRDPFDFTEITRNEHWDYRSIVDDGRVRGDPYVAFTDLAERVAPGGEYDYDVAEYHVEQHYDYPRFTCYDCHSYTHWTAWNPYLTTCTTFRIVIYDDWYYYPYRYYPYYPAYYPYYRPYPVGGVYARPYQPGPRYVFKDVAPDRGYVTRVPERERDQPIDRRTPERPRTSADVGGRGSVPAPAAGRPRTSPGQPVGGAEAGSARRPTSAEPGSRGTGPVDRPASPRRPETAPLREPSQQHEGSGPALESRPGRRQVEGRSPDRTSLRSPSGSGAPRTESPRIRETHEPRPGGDGGRAARPSGRSGGAPTRSSPPSSGSARAAPNSSGGGARSTGSPELRRRRP